MKLQSLNATRKNSNFIIRLNLFLLLYLFVSLSIVKDLRSFDRSVQKVFFRNGLQRYALFLNLQIYF